MAQRIGILGGGESGVGAALLAQKLGMTIWLSEAKSLAAQYKAELIEHQIPFEEMGHTLERLEQSDLVVKSPGIPDQAAPVQHLLSKGIPVISEIDFAYAHCGAKVIAITGSNGKTTTTNLIWHLLVSGGLEAALVGNIGYSFARQLALDPKPCYVVETSSFQLDNIRSFKPDISVLLNITPDHLDRYGYDIALYAASKLRITALQDAGDLFIYNEEDPLIGQFLQPASVAAVKRPIRASVMPEGRVLSTQGRSYSLENPALQGRHNQLNAACAIEAALAAGADPDKLQAALDSFVNAPHRLEAAGIVNGVRYINDSKATNVDAVFYALGAMKTPVVWIAGGLDKGNDYGALEQLVETKVKALICLGLDNSKLKQYYGAKIAWIREAGSAKEAVALAQSVARPGDTVLLSPACASFDLFRNYEDRGEQFKQAVLELNTHN